MTITVASSVISGGFIFPVKQVLRSISLSVSLCRLNDPITAGGLFSIGETFTFEIISLEHAEHRLSK